MLFEQPVGHAVINGNPLGMQMWIAQQTIPNRWSHKGVWARIWEAVSDDPDLEHLMVDGSIVRVHQHGASKKQNATNKHKVSREED